MTAYDDDTDTDRIAEYEAEAKSTTCKRCGGADCYWQEVWTNAGPKWRLFKDHKQHECSTVTTADDFEDLG